MNEEIQEMIEALRNRIGTIAQELTQLESEVMAVSAAIRNNAEELVDNDC